LRLTRDTRWLDLALKAVLVLVVVAIGYLAYTVLTGQAREEETAVTSRTIGDLVAAIEEDPNDLGLRLELAQAYGAAGQFDDAAEQFELVLQLDQDNPAALTGLGLIAMFEGEWDSAEGYWRSVIDEIGAGDYAGVDQRLAVAFHQLGATLIERERYREATKYLREALRIRPHAADTHYALAVAYRELDEAGRQRTHLEDALMFDPLMPEANYDYGLLLRADGDVARAAEHFRISADNAPEGHDEPADELARLGTFEDRLAAARHLTEHDPVDALVAARVARALDPESLEAAKLVARLHQRLGHTTAALEAWQRVLVVWPGEAEAERALEQVERQD
jgi:Tfp pilus assembly protein PilF